MTSNAGRLAGLVALVTGAASGIGRATARLLAREGAVVVCADLNLAGTEEVAREVGAEQGAAQPCRLDVTSESDWEAAAAQAAALGRLGVLVNSAGISLIRSVADMTLEEWRRVLAINLDGVFLGTRLAIRLMGAQGGSIINVSSASGLKAAPQASAYSTSKAAVCMFSRVAARECLDAGLPIRVNAVCPGAVKTPLWRSVPFFQEMVAQTGSEEEAFRALSGKSPAARFAEPEEIARAILYLASEESAFVTGTELVIDGGFTA